MYIQITLLPPEMRFFSRVNMYCEEKDVFGVPTQKRMLNVPASQFLTLPPPRKGSSQDSTLAPEETAFLPVTQKSSPLTDVTRGQNRETPVSGKELHLVS